MSEEISNFITDCASKGINSPDLICNAAQERIKDIDKQLFEADKLRKTKLQMLKIIKSFGGDITKKRHIPKISEETPIEDLDENYLNYAVKICYYIERESINNKGLSPRELMSLCNVDSEKDFEIYAVIKWLCVQGICDRNKIDRALIPGQNWNNRPQQGK